MYTPVSVPYTYLCTLLCLCRTHTYVHSCVCAVHIPMYTPVSVPYTSFLVIPPSSIAMCVHSMMKRCWGSICFASTSPTPKNWLSHSLNLITMWTLLIKVTKLFLEKKYRSTQPAVQAVNRQNDKALKVTEHMPQIWWTKLSVVSCNNYSHLTWKFIIRNTL